MVRTGGFGDNGDQIANHSSMLLLARVRSSSRDVVIAAHRPETGDHETRCIPARLFGWRLDVVVGDAPVFFEDQKQSVRLEAFL